ncbi:unnamed protein product [Candida verbasci]|uniref:NAD-dependent epimerase/dehydratase domain-containing protein n=1 Tax=Candida verbasci TaxID=1227364 RepID=A0A9W4XFL6_9ASCO|nr:unnamed protein product [Candida verbasci]
MPAVYITGANGFIAQHIIKILLEKGYTVIGTIRSKEKGEKLSKIINNPNFQYEIVPELNAPDAFHESLKKHQDIEYIVHSASPVTYTVNDPELDIIIPALKGTENILNGTLLLPKLKKFILTSSDSAIYSNIDERNNKFTFDESSWNNVAYEEGKKDPVGGYYVSKALGEKKAWKFLETHQNAFQLTTVCPSYVFGNQAFKVDPKNLNFSNSYVGDLLTAKNDQFENEIGGFIDVVDVAKAHVFAIENDSVIGKRLFLNNGKFSVQMILDIINKNFPQLNLIKGNVGSGQKDVEVLANVNNEFTKKLLPWQFTSLETSVINTVQQILDSK